MKSGDMSHIKNYLPVFLSIIIAVIFGLAGVSESSEGFKRVNIKPFNKDSEKIIRKIVDVRHEFDGRFSADVSVDQLDEISRLGDVEDVQVYTIGKQEEEFVRTCSPSEQIPWGVKMIGGGEGGEDVAVTVLDTGIMYGHPDLPEPKVCKNTTLKGVRHGCEDDHGHGTHVAGTITANGGPDGLGIYGVAPGAELWVIKVCNAAGRCYGDDISAAIKYASHRGTNIISMSFSGDSEDELVTEAVEDAYDRGVLLVASAGNAGPYMGSIRYPAAHDEVVAVGAIDRYKRVPSWSSRGLNNGDYIIEEMEVEFAAPGSGVLSTYRTGCYRLMSGTSMAAPHISGLAALLWQGDSFTTREYLQELAREQDLFTPGDDPATGFGLPVNPESIYAH